MRNGTKRWLISALALIAVGVLIFSMTACTAGFDMGRIFSGSYDDKTHEIGEIFSDININTDTADITFVKSDDENVKVICHERKRGGHSVTVADGVLKIDVADERKWYDHIGTNDETAITVYMPAGKYGSLVISESTGDLLIPTDFVFSDIDIDISTADVLLEASADGDVKIDASTGDIKINDISVGGLLDVVVSTGDVSLSGVVCNSVNVAGSTGTTEINSLFSSGGVALERSTGHINIVGLDALSLDIVTSTGKVNASDVKCADTAKVDVSSGDITFKNLRAETLMSNGDSGDVILTDTVIAGRVDIERDTGDVEFNSFDAAEIHINVSTGDVTGTLLSDKVYIIKTSTGKIDVPDTITGGRCEITTSTGDVKISVVAE